MSEEKEVRKRKRRKRRVRKKVENAPTVEVNTVQLYFTAYPHLNAMISERQLEYGIGTRSEAIRTFLEEYFGVDPEIRKAYVEEVRKARQRAGKTTSRTVHARKIARKEMERGKWYTKYELAQLTGVSRKTVGRMVLENLEYFAVSNRALPNGRTAELVRIRTQKEVREYKASLK